MLIYVKIILKKNVLRTDGQTDGQPKTIVRNLTKIHNFFFLNSKKFRKSRHLIDLVIL